MEIRLLTQAPEPGLLAAAADAGDGRLMGVCLAVLAIPAGDEDFWLMARDV